jgi:hypothetical protein
MSTHLLADLVLLLHLAFICFVVLGGLLALRWRRIIYFHLPAALWGAWIEFTGGVCPLTPLEQELRRRAGEAGFRGGFVEHYVLPVVYPDWLSRPTQIALGLFVVAVNLAVYGWLARRALRKRRRR